MRNSTMIVFLAMSVFALPVFAQKAPVGAVVSASEPGKAAMVGTVKASAMVTAIDKTARTLTLKGPGGKTFDLEAGEEVRNFDQLAIGDEVVVEYVRALTLELKKGGGATDRKEKTEAVRAEPGQKPGGAVGRQITVMADVIAVSKKNKTITLKGPKGNVVELDVQNPDQFKVVKKGDQVEAVYTEALAISVVPAPKKGGKKK
ncbi:MAG: hypothetical protein IH606_15650 [Burkholderiales bacterium]|nr:hypothetical protein [Burkholderiales bacterium]